MMYVSFPNFCLITRMISKIPSKTSCGVQSVLLVPTCKTTALIFTLNSSSPFSTLHRTFSTLTKCNLKDIQSVWLNDTYRSPPMPKFRQCSELIFSFHNVVNCNCCTIESPMKRTSGSERLTSDKKRLCYENEK